MAQVDGEWIGVEVKRTDAPRMTPSIRNAMEDLGRDRVVVAHAGTQRYQLADRVEAVGASTLLTEGLGN